MITSIDGAHSSGEWSREGEDSFSELIDKGIAEERERVLKFYADQQERLENLRKKITEAAWGEPEVSSKDEKNKPVADEKKARAEASLDRLMAAFTDILYRTEMDELVDIENAIGEMQARAVDAKRLKEKHLKNEELVLEIGHELFHSEMAEDCFKRAEERMAILEKRLETEREK